MTFIGRSTHIGRPIFIIRHISGLWSYFIKEGVLIYKSERLRVQEPSAGLAESVDKILDIYLSEWEREYGIEDVPIQYH